MCLSYIDASGRSDRSDPGGHAPASVTVNEDSWHPINEKVGEIKTRYFPDVPAGQVEFHMKDMTGRSGIYRDIPWEKIYSVLDEIFALIADPDTRLLIIAVVIQKSRLYSKIDVEEWGHRLLFERLNSHLEDRNRNPAGTGRREYGIMITDTEGRKKDQKLHDKLSGMLANGTQYSKLDCLIEGPLFTDSKWHNLSQLVDCAAYCVRKKFRRNTQSMHTDKWNRYYSMIEPKFHRVGGSYMGYGLKVFPSLEG